PLFHLEQESETKFSTSYNLNDSFSQFLQLVEALAADPDVRPQTAPTAPNRRPDIDSSPLDLGKLASVADSLAGLDVSRFVRHHPACLITEDRVIVPVFEEIYPSIPDLERAIGPNVRLTADRWLFQHMTKLLDRRTLKMLTKGGDSDEKAGEGIADL